MENQNQDNNSIFELVRQSRENRNQIFQNVNPPNSDNTIVSSEVTTFCCPQLQPE